jgi:hypothetical protein
LKTIFDQFATATTIQNGFRKFGLFPFNKDDVDYTKFIPNRAIKTSENAPIDHIIIQITWRYKSLYNLYKVWLVIKNEDSTISNIDMESVNQKADVDHNTSFTEEMIIGPPGTPRPETKESLREVSPVLQAHSMKSLKMSIGIIMRPRKENEFSTTDTIQEMFDIP